LCRKSAAKLASIKPQLDELGVQLVAIGSGTPFMAKAFAKEFEYSGELYVDQKREVYMTLGTKRGIGGVIGMRALVEYKKALSEGYTQGGTQGDGMQLGGTFILRSNGQVIWSHMEEFAGDHPDLDEVVAFCQRQVEKD